MSEGVVRWAIVGVGTAGFARSKAIRKDPRAALVAVWRGRRAAETGARQVDTLEEALALADAVAVCSPNPFHAEQVRQALEADRHVVCEYPLAATASEAEALFGLARQRERVLHVEHIELLTGTASALRGNVHAALVRRAEVAFQGRGDTEVPGASLALRNVARLHRLCDVAGPVEAIESIHHAPGTLLATVRLASGAPATLTFEQSPYFARSTRVLVDDESHKWRQENGGLWRDNVPQTLFEAAPLFDQDHASAMRRILEGAAPYVTEDRILHVLRIVEALAEGRIGPVATG